MKLALAGNQNCGKTTLFNALTGANQHVGNFPGVTVSSKTGKIRRADAEIVDLPGIYSLRPYSAEEIVTRDFIIDGKPDGIINIVDATNPERNLYLTLQLLELRVPTVIALNMMDEVRENGGSVDVAKLSARLGVPVVPISAAKGEGINELVRVATDTVKRKLLPQVYDFCTDGPVHRCIHSVSHMIEDHARAMGIPSRFAATKVIEGDTAVTGRLKLSQNEAETVEHAVYEMETERGLDKNAALADMRYTFIERAVRASFIKPSESREHTRSLKIDAVLTNRFAAFPIFIAVMGLIFYLTFNVIGGTLSEWLELGINAFSSLVSGWLVSGGVNPAIQSLVVDGIIGGVGSVLSFLPLIVVLFFFLSVLEDTGYMARVAFIMDKPLRALGLSGRSFVPMIIGFGCSVPAVMATRTLQSDRDRKMTVLLTPFLSCSAKVPIYAVFSAAFFPEHSALVMTGLYLLGIIVGVLAALILGKTVYKGKPVPFVMELPDYRFPSARSVLLLMRDKAKDFIKKAFTIIFVASVIIWFLSSFDKRFNFITDGSPSLLASVGALVSPIFAPLGFGDWRAATALIAGFTAKEAVVTTFEVLGVEDLSTLFTSASAVSFLVFTLLYTPCVAAVAAIKRELGSSWQTLLAVIGQCGVAWLVSFITYGVIRIFTM